MVFSFLLKLLTALLSSFLLAIFLTFLAVFLIRIFKGIFEKSLTLIIQLIVLGIATKLTIEWHFRLAEDSWIWALALFMMFFWQASFGVIKKTYFMASLAKDERRIRKRINAELDEKKSDDS